MAFIRIYDASVTAPAAQPFIRVYQASVTAPAPAGSPPAVIRIYNAKVTAPGGGAFIRVYEASVTAAGAAPGGSQSGRFVLKNNVWTEFKSYTLKNGTWQ